MKYEPLRRRLINEIDPVVELSFDEIERIIGASLPRSARVHSAWWSNSPDGHVNAQAWLAAGFRSEAVDLNRGRLRFRRQSAASSRPGFLERIRATMAGTVHIPEGVDVCEPTGEVWDAER